MNLYDDLPGFDQQKQAQKSVTERLAVARKESEAARSEALKVSNEIQRFASNSMVLGEEQQDGKGTRNLYRNSDAIKNNSKDENVKNNNRNDEYDENDDDGGGGRGRKAAASESLKFFGDSVRRKKLAKPIPSFNQSGVKQQLSASSSGPSFDLSSGRVLSQRFRTELLDPSVHDEYDPYKPNDFDVLLAKKQREFLRKKEALEKAVLGHSTVQTAVLHSPPPRRSKKKEEENNDTYYNASTTSRDYKRYRSPTSSSHENNLVSDKKKSADDRFIPTAPVKLDLDISGDEAFQRRMKMRQTSSTTASASASASSSSNFIKASSNTFNSLSSSHVILIENLVSLEEFERKGEERTEDLAFDIGSRVGQVVKSLAHVCPKSRQIRVFVEFSSTKTAESAVRQLHGTRIIQNLPIKVKLYDERKYNDMELDD